MLQRRVHPGGAVIAVTILMLFSSIATAQTFTALPPGEKPADARLQPLRTLDDYFPFKQVDSSEQWEQRRTALQRQVRVATGMWPQPPRTPLNAVVHGKVERDDYTVQRVYFESVPGHFVTGSLYRPKGDVPEGGRPAVLSPHGHWGGGRFHDHGEEAVRHQIAQGGERFEVGGRHPLQARAVQLARMGAVVFLYDMVGYADSVQLEHRPGVREQMNGRENFGFFSPQAELRQINMMGLQTWNSTRALDFLSSLEDVDAERIGVTGASGGGTQTFILCAIDDRPAVSVPAVMVSTAMQGGCTCENAPHLRIDAGNVDIAALMAPKPMALTGADDWTVEIETKGLPDLRELYAMLDAESNIDGKAFTHFGHNYNAVSRVVMYNWMNRHLGLGAREPAIGRDYVPLTREEATVWTDEHPAPSGSQVGDAHERELVAWFDQQRREQLAAIAPETPGRLEQFRELVGGAVETIVGRRFADVGTAEFEASGEPEERGDHVIVTGVTDHVDADEQLPTLLIFPTGDRWNNQVVIFLHERGKAGLLGDDGSLTPPVAKLLDAGFSVVGVDLFMQGEFTDDGEPITHTRQGQYADGSEPWQQYAGYTFGYNRSLFAQRVHDVLTMVKLADTSEFDVQQVHLVGLGETVGPIAAAAGVLSGEQRVHSIAVDTAGFSFADLDRFDHPMFVPGMVRYGDVPALLALNVPRPMRLISEDEAAVDFVRKAYISAHTGDALEAAAADDPVAAAVNWLIER